MRNKQLRRRVLRRSLTDGVTIARRLLEIHRTASLPTETALVALLHEVENRLESSVVAVRSGNLASPTHDTMVAQAIGSIRLLQFGAAQLSTLIVNATSPSLSPSHTELQSQCFSLAEQLRVLQARLHAKGPLLFLRLLDPELINVNLFAMAWFYVRQPVRGWRAVRELTLRLSVWFWIPVGIAFFLLAHAALLLITDRVDKAATVAGLTAAMERPVSPNELASQLARRGLEVLREGRAMNALLMADQALSYQPDCLPARCLLAMALVDLGRRREGIAAYRDLLQHSPCDTVALNNLADILSTDPDPSLRNGPEAVQLASLACLLTNHQDPSYLTTLAEAQAEAGDLPAAIATAKSALELAIQQRNSDLVQAINARLLWFESGLAVRQPTKSPPPPLPQPSPINP